MKKYNTLTNKIILTSLAVSAIKPAQIAGDEAKVGKCRNIYYKHFAIFANVFMPSADHWAKLGYWLSLLDYIDDLRAAGTSRHDIKKALAAKLERDGIK